MRCFIFKIIQCDLYCIKRRVRHFRQTDFSASIARSFSIFHFINQQTLVSFVENSFDSLRFRSSLSQALANFIEARVRDDFRDDFLGLRLPSVLRLNREAAITA